MVMRHLSLAERMRYAHCLMCNRKYRRRDGYGVSRGFCSIVCHRLAWSEFRKPSKYCWFLACDCPKDRPHTRYACGPRHKGLLNGRCVECGHYPAAHRSRRSRLSERTSFTYDDTGIEKWFLDQLAKANHQTRKRPA